MSAPPPPPPPGGYYPQEAYYAPGWQAPVQPVPPRNRSRLPLVLGIVGGLLALLVGTGAVLGIRYVMDTRPLGAVEEPRSATPRQLATGHCVGELPADGDVSRVQVVPCSEPHEAEVVGVLTLPGAAWPGQNAVERDAVAACDMDTAQQEAGFRPVAWAPSQTGWGQGDRRALCLAWLDGGTATGSFIAGDEVTTR
ncbi:MAG: hypothetical protein JWP95_714 [Actinotalea sp.]|nr:hypothetical protein [Actinotalea sp.]